MEAVAQVDELRAEIQELKGMVQALIYQVGNLPQQAPTHKEWLTGDEACRVLGIPLSESGTHLNRLTWLRNSGFLSVFGSRRPYTYSTTEVLHVQKKIQAGQLFLPARA